MAKEKKDRIGSSAATVYPMKFFFFHDQKETTGLMGSPFHHPSLDDKDVMALVVRLFAHVLDARAVLHATEGWIADRCGSCGSGIAETRDGRCGICNNETVPPSENKYRQEMLICTLSIKHSEKAFFWTSRFERDADERITGFTDQLQCQPMGGSGRFMQVWKLESWMAPHIAVNYATALKALGRDVDEKWIKVARMAEEMAPPNYPFVRLDVKDVMSVLKKMRLEDN
jgi:hypothetical protein